MKKSVTSDKKLLKPVKPSGKIKRRDFFRLLGGGIFIFVHPFDPFEILGLPAQQARSLPGDFNAFLQITEDGMVNCYTGKIEMGQGAISSLPQIMADELEVPYERVKMF